MRDLGDKIASTLVAQSANVSCVPWNGSEIKVNYAVDGIEDSIYQKVRFHFHVNGFLIDFLRRVFKLSKKQ